MDNTIKVFLSHDLPPILAEYLQKVKINGKAEVCGSYIILSETDPDEIAQDIRSIGKEIERIKGLYEQVHNPWIVKDILDKAAFIDNNLIYLKRPKSILREEVEVFTGTLTEREFKEVLEKATTEIILNRIEAGKRTTVNQVIKIAAQCAKALKRCGV